MHQEKFLLSYKAQRAVKMAHGNETICEDYRNDGLGHLEQAGRLITLNLLYPIENQPFATSREALSGLIETLAGNLLRDVT
jgi:hypothetical protein